jgi:hypothetical protein
MGPFSFLTYENDLSLTNEADENDENNATLEDTLIGCLLAFADDTSGVIKGETYEEVNRKTRARK